MPDRRHFLKSAGLATLPALLPALPAFSNKQFRVHASPADNAITDRVNFVSDSDIISPGQYIAKLAEIEKQSPIQPDSYNKGGPVEALQKQFASITGKEKAIYMPTGTMANQFAIAALSGENTKVFVQETSHVYRDEADAAQSVHNKRLIPLAKGATGFTVDDLKSAINYINEEEVFKSGIGAVSIENPVRRANGTQIPFEDLRKISDWCREKKLKMHLDGARLYLASAYSGISIKDYSSLFDTVYVSLYKYFGAAGGAILCGDAVLIDKMEHLIKVFGGTMYQSWPQAAMALHNLTGFEGRYKKAVEKADALFAEVNKLPEIKITPYDNGSNIFQLKFQKGLSPRRFSESLNTKHNIIISGYLDQGIGRIAVNESVLKRDNADILDAIKEGLVAAK